LHRDLKDADLKDGEAAAIEFLDGDTAEGEETEG
jgi:hypothetical protein